MQRLQKVLAQAGVASRRQAEKMILEGRVSVNDEIITEMGYKVKRKDYILVDGKEIQKESLVYFVLHKPQKVISTTNDEHNRDSVIDFIECKERIFPIGRLDYDTSGVILLTNDGEFANLLMHPRYHIPKVYDVIIDGVLSTEHIKKLEKGVEIEPGITTMPAKVKVTNKNFQIQQTRLNLTIYEGRNHQVKKMMQALGYEVRKLHRKQFGNITINDLPKGYHRPLKPFEIKQLKALATEGKLLPKKIK